MKNSTAYKRKTQCSRCTRRLPFWTRFTKGNFCKTHLLYICNKKNQKKVDKLRGVCKETKMQKMVKRMLPLCRLLPFSRSGWGLIITFLVSSIGLRDGNIEWLVGIVKMTWVLRSVRIWFWLCPLQDVCSNSWLTFILLILFPHW